MKQPESWLCIILYIFFIAREDVLSLKTDPVCSNYDLLQNKPMTSDIVNENEIKFYDGKDFTKNTEINTNSIDFITDDLTNYENIETEERAKIISSTEDGNVCLCGKTENLIENNKNDNLTHVYIAGMDDSLMELKRNIQKYGEGHELKVNFYLYKNQKCYDLGHLYTDAYVLRYFIPNCENYFCLDNTKNNWCLDNLSRKHYIEDFNRETASFNFDEKVENYNNQPIVAESKNLCKLIEYVPKEVAGHYEINIPKEQQYMEKNVLDDLNSNNLGTQNTNINSISPQISLLEPEVLGSFNTVKNNNIDYADEENDVNNLNFVTGSKVYKQDINKLEEAINNKDYKTSNDITYNDNKKEYIIVINDSIDSTKSNELYKINENYLNYEPTNTISGKESDYNYVASPCSSEYRKEGDNDIVTSEKNYELLKIVHSYDENNQEQKEFGHNLRYDDGTGTKTYDKCFKTNDFCNNDPEITNTLSTPRYIGGIKTIGNTLSMVKPLKLTFYPYQAYVIPSLQAKNMVCMNKNDPDVEIVDRTFYNNEPILSRPQPSVEQRNGNKFQGYIPTYDSENQIESPQIPCEEATLTDNNIINDVQMPINQETYLKMPDIDNDDGRNYVTLPKFNVIQNKIPWHIKYIPNVANMWKNLPNIQKQLVYDSLNTPREVNKDELSTNLQSKSLFAKSLKPCINTNNYDISANSKIDFLEPQYEKERLYDKKNMFPNAYDTDSSEQEILSLKDNMNNVSPRTEYYIEDPCTYKNLKSLVGSGGSYYTPVTNYQNTNTQIIDKIPYNSDLTKKTFKLKYYPYSIALVDTSIQDMGRGVTSSISPTTINFKPIVENTSDSILVPETNSVTTQDIKNQFNTLDQYKQNYKIPLRIVFTPLSYKIYPSKIVSPKPLTSNICHINPYLGSNINNLNQPLTYKPMLYKNFDNTPLIPTIVENIQSINKMNDISQKSPIQFSDNVVSNNLNINPFISLNQNLQDSMYSVDPTTRNTVCFTKLSDNEKPIVDEYQPSKSVTLDTSYRPFSNLANFPEKSLKLNPKISISRDSLDPNIIGMPIKNSFGLTTTESKYPEIFEKTPFDVNIQENTGTSSLRYKLLKHRPNTEILNSYMNQTPQDEINIYNTNVQNMKRPAVTHYTVYPTPSLQNILISKPHNVMLTPYYQPTVTHSGIFLQNGCISNIYRDKLKDNLLPNSISQVFPIGFNTKTLSDRERLKYIKGQNINNFYNNIQRRLQETPIYQQPLQNALSYETVSKMSAMFSPYVGIPGPSVFVEESNKLRNNRPNQHMINFKEIPVGTIGKDKGNYIIYNPTVNIDNLANTSPKYPMTSIAEDKILTPDYSNSRRAPLSKLYNVCERKRNYFKIPFQSGNVPESSPREYMQYSSKPQELDTEPASSLTYYVPTAKLLPVKTFNINKGLLPVPTKVLLNTNTDIVQSPSTSNREYSLIPNYMNFIPQLFLPSDRSFTGATGYQSKITPAGNTYFNFPYTYDNLKDIYRNNLQTHKEKVLDGFYSTLPPKIRQEDMQSLRNDDFIDYNNIENEGRVQMYSQPYMRVSTITPNIWSTNTILPKNLVVENYEPNGDILTVPSIYNSYITGITPNTRKYNYILNKMFNPPTFKTTEPSLDAKLASQVTTPKINENGEIIQTEIPEGNQGPMTFGNIRYSKPEYQIKMTNNMHQGQDTINIFNTVPEFKQNYLENPSNLDHLNLFTSFNPRTTEREKFNNIFAANIEPLSYLQDNINPIYLTPYFSRYLKPSNINNVVYPFTVKPSLARKQSFQDAVNQIVSSNDPNRPSIPKVYENLYYGIDPSGTTSSKQLSNLYYNPVDLRKSVNSVYDIRTQQNNGYISYSSLNFNPISSSSYITEKESYNTAATKNIYQYFKPTIMKINKPFNWPSKLINYMSPVESYKEQKNNMLMPSDSLTKTAQTSALPNTQNNALFGHDSGITPLINTFDWNVNLQRKESPDTSQYSSYTKYPNTLTSLSNYKRGRVYHPPIPLDADLNSHIYNDVSYSNIPRKSSLISPNAAEIISPKNNIFFNLHNDLKQPINQYNKYISDEVGQNYYVNDNNEIATPNMKRFPITPIMEHEKYPKKNIIFSKLHDSPQTVNMPGHVTYNSKSIPMQWSQGLFSNINNPNYASLNLLYPKNIYSYSSSIPKESNQNLVNPLLSYKYLNKDFDNSSPSHILQVTNKPFSTVKTGEATPVWNNLGTKNSLFPEYNPLPKYDSLKRIPLSEVNFNSIPKINSFITHSNISPITSTGPPASSDRIFNNNDHVPLVHSDYNMITQNIGALQSNAIPMLLPSNAFQTNMDSNPLVKSIISCTNVIPTNQPLLDFSSEIEPQRLISNKTSSEILKSNNDRVYPEQIYSEQGKITFLPKINSYCYDVKGNNLPIHSNEYDQKGLNEKDANIYTIEDNNYSDLYKIDNQKYEILPSISQIEKQIPNYNYEKMKNPFLKSQFADLNYPFNHETKPDIYKFDKISSKINPSATFKPPILYSPTYYQKQNINFPDFFPPYKNSLSIQNHNTLNSVKTSPCTRSKHILFTPHVCKVFKPSTYPISTNEGAELHRSNLNTVYESQMISLPKYLSSSYIEPNRPIYKSIQYQNPAMYQSGNAIWSSDSEKYSMYKPTNLFSDIINYDLSQPIPFNPASTSNIPLQQAWKHNIKGFIESQIENFNQDNPLTKTCYQEDNKSNEPFPSHIDGSNIMDNQNNMKYYQTLPKIVIAKYDPTCHKTFVIKTGDCDLKLKTWRSKLKVITPILVYKVKEIPTINFMPIRNTKYTTEEDMEKAKNYVAQNYGCPTIIKGIFSAYKPYAYINDSSALRDNMPVIWPTLCTCGCGRSGCCCRNK